MSSLRKNSLEKAPFRPGSGSLLGHVGYGDVEWRDNTPFYATMQLMDTQRGRSSAVFIWRRDDGATFQMFMTDLLEVIQKQGVDPGGLVTTTWRIRKRGQNYGLALA